MAPSVFQRLSRIVRSNREDTNIRSNPNSLNNRQTTQYVFHPGESEADRLNRQYNFTKRILHRTTALPRSISPNTVSSVMDVGAGTLVWTLDLLQTTQPRPKRVYACDISAAQFPPREEVESMGITILEHDATERFPPELHG
ncbi:hypothetical protein BD410DRAFT_466714 [Rickenella mellea]|uniref:Methyltransferase domain-containing protein n=1 Tax=Rickenella mellea TaxID=50990 RepID=A0A4Y7PTN0_9AGAM|nr:hypothetical protein BD410DRAFT_466714 [Rickenella mellea]